ncbi:MAG TPA: hypothetical protein VK468_03845, partial [Pyrinomonadaceae bacterium]|nr:hypothetical protein [Pyrinomonadaceae bacterium]
GVMREAETARNAAIQRQNEIQQQLDETHVSTSAANAEIARLNNERQTLEGDLEKQRSAAEQSRLEESSTAKPNARAVTAPLIASFVLSPAMRGAGGIVTVRVPAAAAKASIKLEMETPTGGSYRVELRSASNKILWAGRVQPTGKSGRISSRIVVPANLLRPGSYSIRVDSTSGAERETVGNYPFRTIR